MPYTATLPANIQEKFAKLADALEQASRVARDLSSITGMKLPIPTLTRPKHIPEDQKWFWSNDWQKGEHEVNAALANGDYEIFDSAEELIEDLQRHVV